jgi:hypothetical protein
MPTSPHPSRRRFIQGAGALSSAAGLPVLGAASAQPGGRSGSVLKPEVLVCGGGCAGIAAALAASRAGAKTLLVEKAPFAGGIITSVGLPYFDGIAHIDTHRIVVRGIALELLSKSGVCKPDADKLAKHNPTIPNTFEFKLLLDRLLREQAPNLEVLFNSFACGAQSRGGRVTRVDVANKDGLVRIEPQVVVDCSGDADVAAWAGAAYEQSQQVQPLTLHFRINRVKKQPDLGKACQSALKAAQQRGELPHFYGPGVMFLFGEDEVYVHGVRVPANPTDAADLTRAEMQGRADAHAMFRAWKRDVPAFADAYFQEAYPWIGVRESRRLLGQYILTEGDLMKACRFDDAIATGCWYLDLHPNETVAGSANNFDPRKVQPEPYDIPYRSLLTRELSNLLVAGRCHSATRGAHASTRVTATAMAMGEAAGVAAAMSLRQRTAAAELSGIKVRQELARIGAGPFSET